MKTYIEIYCDVLNKCNYDFRNIIEKYYEEWLDTWLKLDIEYYTKHANRLYNEMLMVYDDIVPKKGIAQFMHYCIPSSFVEYVYNKLDCGTEVA